MADWSHADVPSQAGKVVVLTGGNQGLGFSLLKDFFNPERVPAEKQPAKVIVCCRNREKTEQAIASVPALQQKYEAQVLQFQQLDLGELAAVKRSAEELRGKVSGTGIHTLILNAGVWPMRDKRQETKDGFELAMGTCHFGHFLFTSLLWDLVKKGAGSAPDGTGARVVPVSSIAHEWAPDGLDLSDIHYKKRDFKSMKGYGEAKLANLLFTRELARRCGTLGAAAAAPGKVTCVTLSPGYGDSGLYSDSPCYIRAINYLASEDCDKLSINTMRAATDMKLESGCYLVPKRMKLYGPPIVTEPAKQGLDAEAATKLWDETEKIIGHKFEVN